MKYDRREFIRLMGAAGTVAGAIFGAFLASEL